MAELCCEYLPVRCIWRHILVIVTYTFQSESALYSTLHSTASTFTCPIVLYILPLYPLYALLPVWLNGWVFLYELSGCGFESCCSHFNFRFRSCFEQGVPWNSGNYRVWIYFETRAWHDSHWNNWTYSHWNNQTSEWRSYAQSEKHLIR